MKRLISVVLFFFIIEPLRAESITLSTQEGKKFLVQFSTSKNNNVPTALYIPGLEGGAIKYSVSKIFTQNDINLVAFDRNEKK